MSQQQSFAHALRALSLAVLIAASPLSSADDWDEREDRDDDRRSDELGAHWWQHAASFAVGENPINDDTGERCIVGQRGDVWFLYGSFGNEPGFPTVRECTVPAGVTLFFPIVNLVCIPFPGETLPENLQICRDLIDQADILNLEINDRDRSQLIKRRTQSRPFVLSLPEDNIFDFEGFDAPAGTYLGVGDGYYVKTKLRKGVHTIRIRGGISAFDFELDVIYVLNVVKPAKSIAPR
ncbi:MAG: hypothetical protein R3288_09820 [Woeseiaceae bacterium]|nr:hypothetical protein [Woeseiaceae bacterium]